ncbi:MAG: hypothetical protein KA239_08600 [Bacteroidia bacterium]|nr:hypothetical protein [Bacteroidota bacterium]MBP6722367.1 hypothetical protein [Bacteroidia bacterium]
MENQSPVNRPKVKIGLRAEVAFGLVILLTLSGLTAMIFGILTNAVNMLGVGLVSLTIAGVMGLLLLKPRSTKKK